jgi:Vam6/Vps39-like protein vacuolar protein sorting-associated protein 39
VQTHVSSVARETATVLDTALLQGLVLTNQLKSALDLLKGMNYCNLKICEEFLKERSHYTVLLELYKCNGMHHEALKLLDQLVEETNTEISENIKPSMIIDYLKVSLQFSLFLKYLIFLWVLVK